MESIEFTRPQQALLSQLRENWMRIATAAQREADACANPAEKKVLEGKAAHYLTCAQELGLAVGSGDLPCHFGYQIRRTPHRGLN